MCLCAKRGSATDVNEAVLRLSLWGEIDGNKYKYREHNNNNTMYTITM